MATKIIADADTQMSCPECSSQFPFHKGIASSAIEALRKAYEAQLGEERRELLASVEADAKRKAKQETEKSTEELRSQLAKALASAKGAEDKQKAAVAQALQEAQEASELNKTELERKLVLKEKSLADLRDRELKLLEAKEELEDQARQQALELRRQIDAERKNIFKQTSEEFSLREAEYKKKIEDAQHANAALKRKLEQGSQQLQGEVLELQIEDTLRSAFPFDEIQDVRKGSRGADVIQNVNTRAGQKCGSMIWEAKRAENWSNKWVDKLKDDQQEASANIAVLVTAVFPNSEQAPFIQHDGIWIVHPDTVRPLAEALRTVLLESARRDAIVAGRQEKADELYDYLCSHAFAQRVRGVVDANAAMLEDLNREKAAMQRLWKKREQQIQRGMSHMMGMCGELQGIAQGSLPQLSGIADLSALEAE